MKQTKSSFEQKRDTYHKLDEFHLLPWNKLKPERCSLGWSWGLSSDIDVFQRDSMWIIIVVDDLSAEYWEVPAAFKAIVIQNATIEVEKLQRDLRKLLGAASL